jgi:hypothetical protein
VSKEYGTIVAGGITQTETYLETKDKKKVHAELTKALEVLIENDVDLIIIEYFFYIQVIRTHIFELFSYFHFFRRWNGQLNCANHMGNQSPPPWQLDPRVTGLESQLESAQSGELLLKYNTGF